MIETKMSKKGFALVVAIFLVIGLETVIAGSILGMMRFQRNTQRSADEMKISWAAEAVLERTVKLLHDYVDKTEGEFPDKIVTDRDGTQLVIGGLNPSAGIEGTFEDFIISWYNTALKNRTEYSGALSHVAISDVKIAQLEKDPSGADLWRRYRVDVTGRKFLQTVPTAFAVTTSQEIKLLGGQLFNFFIFCNESCEITAGPNTDLQGPIFSNKDIFLMNDDGSTLRLLRANGFDLPGNPEPYVLHAAGRIYFFFPRFVGRNYLLDDPNYFSAVPLAYKFRGVQTPEVFPAFDLAMSDPLNKRYPPFFRFVDNLADLGCATFEMTNCALPPNRIQVQTGPHLLNDTVFLTPPRSSIVSPILGGYVANLNLNLNSTTATTTSFQNYYADSYDLRSSASISAAFDPQNLWDVDLVVGIDERTNPPTVEFLDSEKDPPINFWRVDNPAYRSGMVKDGVLAKKIPIGSTGVSENETHALIERCRSNPCGSGERFKLQAKATHVLTMTAGQSVTKSPDFIAFETAGILSQKISYDYRNGTNIFFVLNVEKLLNRVGENASSMIIYFSILEDQNTRGYNTLRIVNGSKLPKNGFTIATDGGIWVQGDYNTFDYSKRRHCTEQEWDDENCNIPPAAIFSDYAGILSADWKTQGEGYNFVTPLTHRSVNQDVMINTALATGYRPSGLRRTKMQLSSLDSAYVVMGTGQTVYQASPSSFGLISNFWTGDAVSGLTFNCQDETYKNYSTQGPVGVSSSCEFRELKKGIYEVNPHSHMYKIARARSGSILPCTLEGDINGDNQVDAADEVVWRRTRGQSGANLPADLNGNGIVDDSDKDIWRARFGSSVPADCLEKVRLPIFADPNTIFTTLNDQDDATWPVAVPPVSGVYFTVLDRSFLVGRMVQPQTCRTSYTCTNGVPSPGPPNYSPIPQDAHHCVLKDCEGGEESNCQNQTWINCKVKCPADNWADAVLRRDCVPSGSPTYSPPQINYSNRNYWPLYEVEYSGGVENLWTFLEDWNGRTLRFLGTLSAPWFSKKLQPYRTDYYRAPRRKLDYDENLRKEPPPGTPGVFSIERGRWFRRFDS